MMAGFTGTLAAQVVAFLTSATNGVNARITAMEANDPSLKAAGIRSIFSQNVSLEIAESAGQQEYPVLLVYCERVENLLREKFRGFSGRVHLAIEIRHTQEKLALLERNTE